MTLYTLKHHSYYKSLNKKCKEITGKTIIQLIYADSNILINSDCALKRLATYMKESGYGGISEYVKDLIELEKLDKKLKRIQQGEYLFERDYSTAVKAISMTECRTRIKR